jgi:hypothetical protein
LPAGCRAIFAGKIAGGVTLSVTTGRAHQTRWSGSRYLVAGPLQTTTQTPESEAMKKLKLNRETISILTPSNLEHVHGGNIVIQTTIRTAACPVLTNGCTGGPCVATIGTSGTSVINPSGG